MKQGRGGAWAGSHRFGVTGNLTHNYTALDLLQVMAKQRNAATRQRFGRVLQLGGIHELRMRVVDRVDLIVDLLIVTIDLSTGHSDFVSAYRAIVKRIAGAFKNR